MNKDARTGATAPDAEDPGHASREIEGGVAGDEARSVESAVTGARPMYQIFVCPKCGHQGNDADPYIHHTNVGIICLQCGERICE